jgi:DNA-binding transcriptional LysR family regulator
VRLATTESMATFLMAGLVPLRQEHPKIHVQLVVGSAALDLVRREADLAVRLFREKNPSLVTKKIGDLGWSLYASRAFVERTGLVIGADGPTGALAGHPVIGYAGPTSRAPGARWLAEQTRSEDVVLTCESVPSVLNAVKAGLGLSALPCFAAHCEPALLRLTPALIAHGEAFLAIPPDHRETVRVRLVMDAVTALFERERKMLAGAD